MIFVVNKGGFIARSRRLFGKLDIPLPMMIKYYRVFSSENTHKLTKKFNPKLSLQSFDALEWLGTR